MRKITTLVCSFVLCMILGSATARADNCEILGAGVDFFCDSGYLTPMCSAWQEAYDAANCPWDDTGDPYHFELAALPDTHHWTSWQPVIQLDRCA